MAIRHSELHAASSLTEPVVTRLKLNAPLSERDIGLVRGLGQTAETHWTGGEILSEGQVVRRPLYIVSGWACLRRDLPDGRRQIFGFVLPGDSVGVGVARRSIALTSTVALTTVKTIDATTVHEAAGLPEHRGLASALQAAAVLESALLLDHIVRLGRLTAVARVAHLLLELRHRLACVGLASAHRMPLPMTQETLAECVGLSSVHLNRSLQQLRRENLIELKSGSVNLLQPDVLAAISDFEPTVLPKSVISPMETAPMRRREDRSFMPPS
jgi:CRP-like cAMP-binding protein